MKTYNALVISFCVLVTAFVLSCSSDDEQFLKRNLEQINFSYVESTNTFTIRATGEWNIQIPNEHTWIEVSPSNGYGNGSDYETITVKCERNKAENRKGIIYLNGSGQSDIPINVFQENGLFEWKPFMSGKKFEVDKYPKVGIKSEAIIKIPYAKAIGDENYPMVVTLSGKGANGLTVSGGSATITAEGDGELLIPILGTATTQGLVEVKVSIDGVEFGTDVTLAAIGQEIISQSFDKLPWGGDCIANKAGVVSTVTSNASLSLGDPTRSCAVGDNGSVGLTSTIREANPAFYTSLGLDGWLGFRTYMRPGYLQLGAASATDKEFGSLITPGLAIPAGMQYDILVKFKGAKYNNPSTDELMLALYPKGKTGLNASSLSELSQKVYMPFDVGYQNWGDFSAIVQNVTDASALVISIPDYWIESNVKPARVYLDNIIVIY